MSIEDFEFVTLSIDTEIKPFVCRDEDLNQFLLEDAKNYLKELMAVTYLFEDRKEKKTVAYFSLLNDKVSYDPESRSIWNRLSRGISNSKRRKTYPSVKIGRLAVAKDYEGNDIGSDILNFIKIAFTNKNRTGCRFITLDAYADVVDFYLKNGFNFFTDKDKNDKTRLMYFDLKPFKDAQNNV